MNSGLFVSNFTRGAAGGAADPAAEHRSWSSSRDCQLLSLNNGLSSKCNQYMKMRSFRSAMEDMSGNIMENPLCCFYSVVQNQQVYQDCAGSVVMFVSKQSLFHHRKTENPKPSTTTSANNSKSLQKPQELPSGGVPGVVEGPEPVSNPGTSTKSLQLH